MARGHSAADDPITLETMPKPSGVGGTAVRVQFGRPIPAQQQILLYSPAEWEEFIYEWVHCQHSKYSKVVRMTGANDMGVDIAGLTDGQALHGVWDNFQCKHYADAISPSTAAAEIAKILWHSFSKHYAPPRNYYFVAPRGVGPGLRRLLGQPETLRDHVIEHWTSQCSEKVTDRHKILLDGDFKEYVSVFDFSIFSWLSPLEIIDDHRQTPYHAIRFGGGLPDRPAVPSPPIEPKADESTYVKQMFDAYSDHLRSSITDLAGLATRQDLVRHFHRQREFFYHAESLRNFARDNVPPGTFEDLQSEIYAGVIDVEAASHPDGYTRMSAVTQAATQLQLTQNALISVVKVQDRKGMCHQLANDTRLTWRKP